MNRAAAKSLGGAAALALLFCVLSAGAAYQERAKMAPVDQLARAQGVVGFARTHVNISGARFKTTSQQREFRIAGTSHTFIYEGRWPNLGTVEAEVTTGRQVRILYGGCTVIIRATSCRALQIEAAGHGTIAAVEDVLSAIHSRFELWVYVAAFSGLACLGLFAGYVRMITADRVV